MYTESAFHHQGYEILKDLEPYMRDLTGKQLFFFFFASGLLVMRRKTKKNRKRLLSILGLLHDVNEVFFFYVLQLVIYHFFKIVVETKV